MNKYLVFQYEGKKYPVKEIIEGGKVYHTWYTGKTITKRLKEICFLSKKSIVFETKLNLDKMVFSKNEDTRNIASNMILTYLGISFDSNVNSDIILIKNKEEKRFEKLSAKVLKTPVYCVKGIAFNTYLLGKGHGGNVSQFDVDRLKKIYKYKEEDINYKRTKITFYGN